MSLGTKDIVKNIASKAYLPNKLSKEILTSFLEIIKSPNNNKIKISKFGVFYRHNTPERLGRNPKTKKEYIIPTRRKLLFRASTKLKYTIN